LGAHDPEDATGITGSHYKALILQSKWSWNFNRCLQLPHNHAHGNKHAGYIV